MRTSASPKFSFKHWAQIYLENSRFFVLSPESGEADMATNPAVAIEQLADAIGKNVYIDVAKWHLYLRDAHLHKPLAEQIYPLATQGTVSTDQVAGILGGIMVKLGGGKREVPLSELLPMQSQVHLMDVIEEFQRDL
jgi:hypothetical protein